MMEWRDYCIIQGLLFLYSLIITIIIIYKIETTQHFNTQSSTKSKEDQTKNNVILSIIIFLFFLSLTFLLLSILYPQPSTSVFFTNAQLCIAFIVSATMWDYASRENSENDRIIFIILTFFFLITLFVHLSMTNMTCPQLNLKYCTKIKKKK